MKRSARTTRFGFSLIEMLVVVAIVAIIVSISFPMIGAMRRDSSASTGINTVSVAIPSIRRYATTDMTFSNDLDTSTLTTVELGIYSGAAVIFTPAGEIRFTRNFESAESLNSFAGPPLLLEQRGPSANNIQGNGLPKLELNGFKDLDVDYLILPSDTGVAGINRVSGGKQNGLVADYNKPPLLLPPPFAVWYNQSGYLVATGWDAPANQHNAYQYVYYDSNYDSDFNVRDGVPGSFRWTARSSTGGNYDPDEYNPNDREIDPTLWNDVKNKYILPFEALEAVVGVFIYSQDEFRHANNLWDNGETDTDIAAPAWTETNDTDNEARWEWLKKNGEMVMFSKQSGALMRNRNE